MYQLSSSQNEFSFMLNLTHTAWKIKQIQRNQLQNARKNSGNGLNKKQFSCGLKYIIYIIQIIEETTV